MIHAPPFMIQPAMYSRAFSSHLAARASAFREFRDANFTAADRQAGSPASREFRRRGFPDATRDTHGVHVDGASRTPLFPSRSQVEFISRGFQNCAGKVGDRGSIRAHVAIYLASLSERLRLIRKRGRRGDTS